MKKLGLIVAALAVAAVAMQPAWAQSRKESCYTQAAIEAEQAIRYMTELMVISSACQNTTYAEFRLRNRDAIISYQKAMITHFRGAPAFDKWNTALANQEAQKHGGAALGVFCQQAEPLLKHANSLDPVAFRAHASAKATTAAAQYAKCGK